MDYRFQILTEQQELVRRLHEEEGLPYREIAEGLRLSRTRVAQIAEEARQRLEDYEADPRNCLAGLPGRVRNILEEYLDFRSRAEVLEAVKSGRLYYDAKKPRSWPVDKSAPVNFARLRNAGWRSWETLLLWLGIETEEEQAQRAEEMRLKRRRTPPSDSLIKPVISGKCRCPICDKEFPADELPAHLAEHWRAHTVEE